MGFVGFVLFFLIIWIIVMVVMAVFAIICIIFSALSASKAKEFLAYHRYSDYKSARSRFIPALVFFILTCLTSASALLSLEAFIAMLTDGSFGSEDIFDPTTLFFIAAPALLIVAVVLGIRCFIWYGRANKLNTQLSAAAMPPRFFSTAQSFKVCPICGSANDTVNSFCVKCGQPLQ